MNIKGKPDLGDHIRAGYLSMGGWIHYSGLILASALATAALVYAEWSSLLLILFAFTAFSYLIAIPFFQWLFVKLDPSRIMYV